MTKKKSSKTSPQTTGNVVVDKEKSSSMPKKPGGEIDDIFSEQGKVGNPKKFGNEIDDIFSSKKRKKTELDEKAGDGVTAISNKKKKKKSQARNTDLKDANRSVDVQPTRPRKRTGDGLTIYTEDELGVGKVDAGGTRRCPFDCDCCF